MSEYQKATRREVVKWVAGLGMGLVTPTISWVDVPTANAQESINCPIFMYHQTDGYAVESILSAHIQAGRTPITVSELGDILTGRSDLGLRKPFCLTFDDGYRVQYDEALPTLLKWQSPATFYVMGVWWRGDGVHSYMTNDQKLELHRAGMEIGSHTENHDPSLIALRARDKGAYLAEIINSKSGLEGLIQSEVAAFSSPNSVYDQGVITDVNQAGYRTAVMTAANQKIIQYQQDASNIYQLARKGIN